MRVYNPLLIVEGVQERAEITRMAVSALAKATQRVKVLPSIPPSALPLAPGRPLQLYVYQVGLDRLAGKDCEVYIRHEPTVNVIRKYARTVEVKTGEAKLEPYELFYVVSLRKRAPTPGADVPVTEEDLLVLECVTA